MSAPPSKTEAMWKDFITCLKDQDLISSAAVEAQALYPLTKTAVSRPLLFWGGKDVKNAFTGWKRKF